MAGYSVDRSFSVALERQYDSIRSQLQLIAVQAEKNMKALFGREVNFTDFVDAATNGYIYQLQNYVLYENQQIKALRSYLAGDTPELDETSYVTPASISRDTLAAIGGANLDPATAVPLKDSQGNYVVGAVILAGLLYTGATFLGEYVNDFESTYGYKPSIKYRWYHTSPLDRSFPEHLQLQGKSFTTETAAIVLRNDTVPWIGPVFYPGDHWHCRCLVAVEAE